MKLLSYDLPYNIYVLFFGVYISMKIACGSLSKRQWRLFLMACPLLLLLQGIMMLLGGAHAVRLFYPLISHLPLILILAFPARIRGDIALVSVAISYSICQLPRWIGLLISMLALPPAAVVFFHIAVSHLLLLMLDRFCLSPIHRVISERPRILACLGALPLLYYAYEYFLLYTNNRYTHLLLLSELLPTGMVIFFILFAIVYHRETDRRLEAENQMLTLQTKFHQAEKEMDALRFMQEQTAIFRHDMHHHLAMISGFLSAGKSDAAAQYIRETRLKIDAIVPDRLCDHEAVNLLLCAYKNKAEHLDIAFHAKAELPNALSLSDTELCALLSNALENALNAAQDLPKESVRQIDVLCCIRQENLLLEVKNPYFGEIAMANGLPISKKGGAHYGCRSIQSIAGQHHGQCVFLPADGIFTVRVAIPLS